MQHAYMEQGSSDADVVTLMLKGEGLRATTSDELKEFLGQYTNVKDVSLIKNKQTGISLDTALIHFYNNDEADYLLRFIRTSSLTYNGHALFSSISSYSKADLERVYSSAPPLAQDASYFSSSCPTSSVVAQDPYEQPQQAGQQYYAYYYEQYIAQQRALFEEKQRGGGEEKGRGVRLQIDMEPTLQQDTAETQQIQQIQQIQQSQENHQIHQSQQSHESQESEKGVVEEGGESTRKKVYCLVCRKKFKDDRVLRMHNMLSNLHKHNTQA